MRDEITLGGGTVRVAAESSEEKPMPISCSPAAAGIPHLSDVRRADLSARKIAIVNGSRHAVELFETAPEFDRYTLLSLNSRTGAYGDIKRLRPSLVVLCARPEDEDDACRLLTILKLDQDTRDIPVLTVRTDDADEDTGELDSTAPCAAGN
jgi:hypothetical protein